MGMRAEDRMMRVLVVEDDAGLRNSLRESLEMEGCDSEGAESAEEAITLLSGEPFDLVVTDYNLGAGSNGLFLLSYLKKSGSGVPMILMSGYRERRLEDSARQLGVSAFLEKPFPIDAFLDECMRALTERPTTQNRKGRMRRCEIKSSWQCS
jgi:two-component system response regulator FlrC